MRCITRQSRTVSAGQTQKIDTELPRCCGTNDSNSSYFKKFSRMSAGARWRTDMSSKRVQPSACVHVSLFESGDQKQIAPSGLLFGPRKQCPYKDAFPVIKQRFPVQVAPTRPQERLRYQWTITEDLLLLLALFALVRSGWDSEPPPALLSAASHLVWHAPCAGFIRVDEGGTAYHARSFRAIQERLQKLVTGDTEHSVLQDLLLCAGNPALQTEHVSLLSFYCCCCCCFCCYCLSFVPIALPFLACCHCLSTKFTHGSPLSARTPSCCAVGGGAQSIAGRVLH